MGTFPLKKVINSDPGDADHVGGNDWDDLSDGLNNVDKTGPIKMNTNFYFRDQKFRLRNPADTFDYIFANSAITGNTTVTVPLLLGNDEILFKNFGATISKKTLDSTCDVSNAVGSGVTAAQYLALATHANLSQERVFTPGDGHSGTDGGANGNYTFNTDIQDEARKRVRILDDFLESTSLGSFTTDSTGTGATVSNATVTDINVHGMWEMQTGTTSAGVAGIKLGNVSSFVLGQGLTIWEGKLRLPVLSTVGDEYFLRIGLSDSDSGQGTDLVQFEYDRLTSTSWRARCRQNGTSSTTTTSGTVDTLWNRLKFQVNAAGTSVDFFLNGTNIGTISANIPNVTGRELTVACSINKSAGTTNRVCDIDYITMDVDLTTAR